MNGVEIVKFEESFQPQLNFENNVYCPGRFIETTFEYWLGSLKKDVNAKMEKNGGDVTR